MFVPLSRRQLLSRDSSLSLLCLRNTIARGNGSRNHLLHLHSSKLFSSTNFKGKPSNGAEVTDTPKLARPETTSTATKYIKKRKQPGAKSKSKSKSRPTKQIAIDEPTREAIKGRIKLKAKAKNSKKAAADSVAADENIENVEDSAAAPKKTITTKRKTKTTKASASSSVKANKQFEDAAEVEKEDVEGVTTKWKSKRKKALIIKRPPSKLVVRKIPYDRASLENVSSEGREGPPQVVEPEKSTEQLALELQNLQHLQGLFELVKGGKLSDNAKSAVLKALGGALSSGSPLFQKKPQSSSLGPAQNGDDTIADQEEGVQQTLLTIRKQLARATKVVAKRRGKSLHTTEPSTEKPGTDARRGEVFFRNVLAAKVKENSEVEDDTEVFGRNFEVKTLKARKIVLTPIDKGELEVPPLAYGLERVLFNPGVYQLQDPRTHVFNFDPYLQTIMPVNEFDFSALKEYITSSRDNELLARAKIENKKYTGSTSSMSSALAHFHFLLSQWRPINTGNLTKTFPVEQDFFTSLQRAPVAVFLRWRDGTYAIDADKEFDTTHILMELGKSMEKLLTNTTANFERYRKGNSHQVTDEERHAPEAFHYSTLGDFLLRSQLDAHDPRLPGTGMFDLKTRAVVSVRMNAKQYEESKGYEITGRHGEWSSYEREYFDMIRAAFLKYSMQVRMGRMDGIFVAFHNTERIFGFQYISLQEMDYCIHGTDNLATGDGEFKLSISLLNDVLDKATAKFPGKTLRLHFETRPAITPFMYIFAEPCEEEEVERIQNTKKAQMEKFRKDVLGIGPDKAEWAKLEENVDDTMAIDEIDPEGLNELIEGDKASDELDNTSKVVEDDGETSAGLAGDDGTEDADEDAEEDEVEEEHDDDENEDEHEAEEDIDEEQDDEHDDQDVEETERSEAHEAAEEIAEGSPELEAATELNGQEPPTASESTESDENFIQDDAAESDDIIYEDGTDVESSTDSASNASTSETGTAESTTTAESDPSNASSPESTDEATPLPQAPEKAFLAMSLTIRNKVNGTYVTRPEHLDSSDNWEVEYSLREIEDPIQATTLYDGVKARRKKMLTNDFDVTKNSSRQDAFLKNLKDQIKKGKEYRARLDKAQKGKPVKVLTVETVPAWGKSTTKASPEPSSVESSATGEEKASSD